MGRCPVRAIFPEALKALTKNQHKLRYILSSSEKLLCVLLTKDHRSFMFDKIMPLTEAVEAYELFDKMKVQKVIFTPDQ